MTTLGCTWAETGGGWAEVFPSAVFLLPVLWAGGLSGGRETWTWWAGTGTGEHEEAWESISIHPHLWHKEENEDAETRANEHTKESEDKNINCLYSNAASLSNKKKSGND